MNETHLPKLAAINPSRIAKLHAQLRGFDEFEHETDNKTRMKVLKDVTSALYFEKKKIEFNEEVLKYLNDQQKYLIINILKGRISEIILRIDNAENLNKEEAMRTRGFLPKKFTGPHRWEYEYIRIENGYYDNRPCDLSETSYAARVYAERYYLLDYYDLMLTELGFESTEILTELADSFQAENKNESAVEKVLRPSQIIKSHAIGPIYKSLLECFDKNDQKLLKRVLKETDGGQNQLYFLDGAKVLCSFFREAYELQYIAGTKKALATWLHSRFSFPGKKISLASFIDHLSSDKAPKRPPIKWKNG